MKVVVTTCAGREHFVRELKKQLPDDTIYNFDDFTDTGKFTSTAWWNYLRSWELVGDEPTLQMDDDIILCDNFMSKALAVIEKHPNVIIQFFSMRKKDIEIGSRVESGSTFMMKQCYYLPAKVAADLRRYADGYYETMVHGDCGSDILMRDYFKSRGMKYLIHVPSLVNHAEAVSKINPRRSSKRQSLTFKK